MPTMGIFSRSKGDAASEETEIARNASQQVDPEKQEKASATPGYKGKEDPFSGSGESGEVNYKTLTWWMMGMTMIAETISLGILSLPSVLAAIGFAPGMILIFGLGLVATYTAYTIGQFKMRYPHVHNMADAGEVMLGSIGREIFGAAQIILLIFVMASHVLTFSIMLNVLSGHGACTIAFAAVGAIVCYIFTLPRTLGTVSYLATVSFISITSAVVITMIGVGVEKPDTNTQVTVSSSLAPAFVAVSDIIFAYSGHVAFFSFISELREPTEYPKAVVLLQVTDTSMYLLVAAVTYAYAGADVASPALGSTSPLLQKVAYGIAIPTIVIAGVINGHVAAKYIYVRMYRGKGVLTSKSFRSYAIWAIISVLLWVIAWIIAEAIPTFNDLLSLISALFASWFTYGLSGVFWLYINKGKYFMNWRKMTLTVVNVIIFFMGAAICGLGLYASGTAIKQDSSTANGAFTCADNSKS